MNLIARTRHGYSLVLLLGLTLAVVAACGTPETAPVEPAPLPQSQTDPLAAAPGSLEPGSEAWLEEYRRTLERIRAGETVDPNAALATPVTPLDPVPMPVLGSGDPLGDPLPITPAPISPAPFTPAPISSAPVQVTPVEIIPVPIQVPSTNFEPAPSMPAPSMPVQQPVQVPAAVQAPTNVQPLRADDVDAIVAASRQHASLVDGRIAALVGRFRDEGLIFLESGRMQEAHVAFGHAYELDPTDPGIRDLYFRTGASLGNQGMALGAAASGARQLAEIKEQQTRVLVMHHRELGQRAMAEGNPGQALQSFEDALAILQANPGVADQSLRVDDLQALVRQAEGEVSRDMSDRDRVLRNDALALQQDFERSEAEQGQRKISALFDTANKAFVSGNYPEAERALDEILRQDRGNPDALELRQMATRARHDTTARNNRETFREEWQDTFDDLDQDMTPSGAMIEFPDAEKWAAIEARGPRNFSGGSLGNDPEAAAIQDRLDSVRIPVSFEDLTLAEVLDNLGQVTGVNFLMSQEVSDTAPDLDPYNLADRAEQPVSRILKIILEDLTFPPLSSTIQDGVVKIITEDEARSDYVLQMYDIRDLTFIPTDYQSEDFNLLPSGTDRESFLGGVEDDEPVPFIGEDNLLTLIQDNIAPDSWSDDPERTIQLMPGTLVVRQTPEVHAKIDALLENLRSNTSTMIKIETRFLEVEDNFLEDIGVDLRGLDDQILEDFGTSGVGFGTPTNPLGIGTDNEAGLYYSGNNGDLKGRIQNLFDVNLGDDETLVGSGGLSLQALFLKDTEINAVMRAVTKYETSNVVNAPSLTLRSGQRGTVSVLTTRTYVRDYEPEIAQAAVIAQPELDNVREGMVLDVRAVTSADRRFVTLELRPTLAELVPDANGDVLPDVTVSVAGGNASDVTIQVPELRIQRVRTTATIPDGYTLMLGGLKRSIDQDLESGVPFLSDIPGLGFFFNRQGEYVSHRKILILLKVEILIPEEREPTLR